MNGDFSCLCAEHISFHTYKIAYVKQFFEHHIIEVFVFTGAQLIAVHIHLNAAV